MPVIIVKNSRDSTTPYTGPSCDKAAIPPGLIYVDLKLAQQHLERLNAVNPVGFKLVEIE